MISRRASERIPSSKKCVLNHKGESLACRLKDLSASGVLVKCIDAPKEELHPGEVCTIKFEDPELRQRKFRCSVSRQDSKNLALQFLFLER